MKRAADPPERIRVARWRRRHRYRQPIPGLLLRTRVGAGTSIDFFVESGRRDATRFCELFARHGTRVEDAKRVLDFGCGCGRILAHMPSDPPELWGSDVDRRAAAWAESHLRGVRTVRNDFMPPLPFPDGHFDRVYSYSIFTHLTESQQDAWLTEIARVLTPDGTAVVTTNGLPFYSQCRDGTLASHSREFTERLRSLPDLSVSGFIFEPYTVTAVNRADFPGIEDTYGLTFHSPAYISEHWSRLVDVVAHDEAANKWEQDFVVLRRRG